MARSKADAAVNCSLPLPAHANCCGEVAAHAKLARRLIFMRLGCPVSICNGLISTFARVLIALCISNSGASAMESSNATAAQGSNALGTTVRDSLEQCQADLAVQDLDPIRAKADISRMAFEGPPPFSIALDDTFPTDSERAVIAKWITIWNRCRQQLRWSTVGPTNAMAAAALAQEFALSRFFHSNVGHLIQALYYQELTYGEFALKRFQFTRDAVALRLAIDKAQRDSDQNRLVQTRRQFLYLRLSWNIYLRRVHVREPGKAPVRRAIFALTQ